MWWLCSVRGSVVSDGGAGDTEDERVTLEEFLAEVKKTYDVSPKVAEKMLFIYERTLKQRNAEREEAEAEGDGSSPADAPAATEVPAQEAVEFPPVVIPRNEF